jgi:hypothetical protein
VKFKGCAEYGFKPGKPKVRIMSSKQSYNPTRTTDPGKNRRYSPSQEIAIAPKPKGVQAYLDELALQHAVETAEAMTDEEQEIYLTRKKDLEGIPLEGGPNDD